MTDFKVIPLTKGYSAIVDASDYEWLSQWKWHASVKPRGSVYAMRSRRTARPHNLYMHREILVTDLQVDHRNGNSLDNRRENLRPATPAQNRANKRVVRSASGFKGVTLCKDRIHQKKMWQARIVLGGKSVKLGRFATPEEAADVYDAAAIALHGEFAGTNKSIGLRP